MTGDELSTMFTLCVIFSVLPLLFSLFLWIALITGGVLQGGRYNKKYSDCVGLSRRGVLFDSVSLAQKQKSIYDRP